MKNSHWFAFGPIILFFSICFVIAEGVSQGELNHPIFRSYIYPRLKSITGFFTDLKFKMRGARVPKNKIVIVEIDNFSLDEFGRWPWHRDLIAATISKIFSHGAKTVGLDITFAEPDQRVPTKLGEVLKAHNLQNIIPFYETDRHLEKVILTEHERLVLGWAYDGECQPLFSHPKVCPFSEKDFDPRTILLQNPADFDKFAFSEVIIPKGAFVQQKSPLHSVFNIIVNMPLFHKAAWHSGFFGASQDPDGTIRSTLLFTMIDQKAYPSLPLAMAKVGLQDDLVLELDSELKVKKIALKKTGFQFSGTRLGYYDINFRGPGHTFTYLSVLDLLKPSVKNLPQDQPFLDSTLKDAYVILGLTALGVFDMRTFPFEANVPGVEGQATILDNILANDFIRRGFGMSATIALLCLMVFGAIGFSMLNMRLNAAPALGLALVGFLVIFWIDIFWCFQRNINLNTVFFHLEMFMIFVTGLALKYVLEEKNKKFIRGAFAKYVAPAVVESILKEPSKLTVGGEKKDLTIMFSDIRGFTTFSERMDAKALSMFLNEYLSIQTKIVFQNQGTLDKYIGDAIMAFWGAPLIVPMHASLACQAARQMMQALNANHERFLKTYGVDVHIGIGINTGTVSVGNMGSTDNFAYTVIGDHVNLASRLEGLTKPYGATILTTRFTFDDILKTSSEIPPHRVLDFVKVKGKKQAVELIQVFEVEIPQEGVEIFNDARKLYLKRDWDQAIEKFTLVSKILYSGGHSGIETPDEPSEMYMERCRYFRQKPPPDDWDGTWEMTSK